MKYWIEFRKGINAPVGFNKTGNYSRKWEKDSMPFPAKEAIQALRTNPWATGLIPAKEGE